MKFFEILFSYLTAEGKSLFQNQAEALSTQVVDRVRRMVILITITFISTLLFCNGFFMGYSALVASIERGDGWSWSVGLGGGIILAAASVGGLIYSLGAKRWADAVHKQESATAPRRDTELKAAATLLVVELVQQLKESRTRARKNSSDPS